MGVGFKIKYRVQWWLSKLSMPVHKYEDEFAF